MPLETVSQSDLRQHRRYRRAERAVAHHFPLTPECLAVQVFAAEAGQWIEVVRSGSPKHLTPQAVLAQFDATAGGTVEALPDALGWQASYTTEALQVPLCVLLHLAPLDAPRLKAQLTSIEARIGWVALAVCSDVQEDLDRHREDGPFTAKMLLKAAQARSQKRLFDTWIAGVEPLLQCDFIGVCWHTRGATRLMQVSGGGSVLKPSQVRTQLEALAQSVKHRTEAVWLAMTAEDAEPHGQQPSTAIELSALGIEGALLVPIRTGSRQRLMAVLIAAYVALPPDPPEPLGGLLMDVLSQSVAVQAASHPSPIRRTLRWLTNGLIALVGPRLWRVKLAFLSCLAVGLWASMTPMQAEPGFSARVEARQRQIISAPFDGFLQDAPHRLGDRVAVGTRLLTLDTAETQLELARQEAELAEVEQELQTARGRRDAAAVRRLTARESQIQIVLTVLRSQIADSTKDAVVDSIVLGGDAWQRVGDRVRLGEPLLEIASTDALRFLAFVNEDWITEVDVGTAVRVQLNAYPDEAFEGAVESIGTDTRAIEGVNTFPVWISLPEAARQRVLDGMRGVARLQLGETTWLRYYSRGIQRWAARQLWRWRPA